MTWFDEGVESALYPHALFFHPLLLTRGCAVVVALPGTVLLLISLLGELTWATKLTEKHPQEFSPLSPSSKLPTRAP